MTRREQFKAKRDRITALYGSGLSLRQVGAEVGLTQGAVRSALINAGVTPRGYSEGRRLRGTARPKAQRCLTGHTAQFLDGERVHDGEGGLKPRTGKDAPHWKGGRYVSDHARPHQESQPYVYVYRPEHPSATKAGYVMEHRLVAEQKIGRLLTKAEVVHHVNGDRLDNRPENLEVMTRREHVRLHFSHAALVAKLRGELERYRRQFGDLPPEP